MNGSCDQPEEMAAKVCCPSEAVVPVTNSCCHEDAAGTTGEVKRRIDYMLWGCIALVMFFYVSHWLVLDLYTPALAVIGHSVYELINTMWWSVLLAALFVGLLSRIPQDFVTAILGRGGSLRGILRATLAGVLLDLCSHGILMVGMKLYQKGASLGQVMAFLIASPWNSLSLTMREPLIRLA